MTKNFVQNLVFLLLCDVLFAGNLVESLSYDYSASIECLADPPKPQYGGGIIRNAEFNNGLEGWSSFGSRKVEQRVSKTGNMFIVAHSRKQSYHSLSQKLYLHLSQKLYLQKGKIYTISAWVQVNEGTVHVTIVFKTAYGFNHAGAVMAESGCWSMIKGGLTAEVSGQAELYFESNSTTVEIWIDSVSLQPFTKKQWRAHQAESIEKVRKKKVRFHAVDAHGTPLAGATLSLENGKPGFPFGSSIPKSILTNTAYQNWFTSRFTVTTFENEMKWYSTESFPGKEDYSVPDAMLAFANLHGISVRGHNVFWDDPQYQQWWVKALSPNQLRFATAKRINSIMSRYAGKVIGWDVVNENLHFRFYEDRLGLNASEEFFERAHQLDPNTLLFLNDYNTIEEPEDGVTIPGKYLKKLRDIKAFCGNRAPIAIGLEGHFSKPNVPYIRAALDVLAGANVPIWLTEVDIEKDPNQAMYLEEVLREAHAHPVVQGIVMWAGWHQEGCYKMCLTDGNFQNLPTGDVVDKLIGEWKSGLVVGTTDGNGFFEAQLFHGDYVMRISHPSMNSSWTQSLKVDARASHETTTLNVEVHA